MCKKIQHPTKVDALLTLGNILVNHRNDEKRKERKIYKCDKCNRWHLTSRETSLKDCFMARTVYNLTKG